MQPIEQTENETDPKLTKCKTLVEELIANSRLEGEFLEELMDSQSPFQHSLDIILYCSSSKVFSNRHLRLLCKGYSFALNYHCVERDAKSKLEKLLFESKPIAALIYFVQTIFIPLDKFERQHRNLLETMLKKDTGSPEILFLVSTFGYCFPHISFEDLVKHFFSLRDVQAVLLLCSNDADRVKSLEILNCSAQSELDKLEASLMNQESFANAKLHAENLKKKSVLSKRLFENTSLDPRNFAAILAVYF